MKAKTQDIFSTNSDLLALLHATKEIGWTEIRQSSVHRLFYLASILYSFRSENHDADFKNYHFSLSATGPYSEAIDRSIIDLTRRDVIVIDDNGNFKVDLELASSKQLPVSDKIEWFRVIVYLLGLYGEDKIFGFIIYDPQYKYDFQRNSKVEIDTSSHNKTVETLKQFKNAFEETLEDVSEIDDKEYLELYFEYVFSKIIKGV